uniref:uncharacterized protein LOC113198673 n=1 Tax=Urocitellus parryii TaxID=9999 RepID=UPI000E55ED29|nr:uncharacterized protein LOC113198673 [Urocitellus parryii]
MESGLKEIKERCHHAPGGPRVLETSDEGQEQLEEPGPGEVANIYPVQIHGARALAPPGCGRMAGWQAGLPLSASDLGGQTGHRHHLFSCRTAEATARSEKHEAGRRVTPECGGHRACGDRNGHQTVARGPQSRVLGEAMSRPGACVGCNLGRRAGQAQKDGSEADARGPGRGLLGPSSLPRRTPSRLPRGAAAGQGGLAEWSALRGP